MFQQFDKNLDKIFEDALKDYDRAVYEQALINHHKEVTDKDMKLGLFDTYTAPEWLTMR